MNKEMRKGMEKAVEIVDWLQRKKMKSAMGKGEWNPKSKLEMESYWQGYAAALGMASTLIEKEMDPFRGVLDSVKLAETPPPNGKLIED